MESFVRLGNTIKKFGICRVREHCIAQWLNSALLDPRGQIGLEQFADTDGIWPDGGVIIPPHRLMAVGSLEVPVSKDIKLQRTGHSAKWKLWSGHSLNHLPLVLTGSSSRSPYDRWHDEAITIKWTMDWKYLHLPGTGIAYE